MTRNRITSRNNWAALPIVVFFQFCRTFLGIWSKNYWADCEKVRFFLNLIVLSVRILSFNPIYLVIKKLFHKGPLPIMGPVRNGVFYFWIFLNEIWYICR
jgi:hypothetical protein